MTKKLAASMVLVAATACGCGTKADASLSAFTKNPVLARSDGAFGPGTVLTGSVDLVLDEGAYSQGSVSVQSVTLRLFRGTAGSTDAILPRAQFDTVPPVTYPIVVNAGDRATIHFTISIAQMTAQEQTDLCSGTIVIAGFVAQSSNPSQQQRIEATPITATGC